MPPESDPRIVKLLIDLLRSGASNAVTFKQVAIKGAWGRREGLHSLLPGDESTLPDKQRLLKLALAKLLEGGERPTRKEEQGDAEMQFDPCVDHHFRVTVASVRLFVKVSIEGEDEDDPRLKIKSVKPDDRAWK